VKEERLTPEPPGSPEGRGPGRFEVQLGSWEELGAQARRIRFEVFVVEQGVPLDLEIDSADPGGVHALASRPGGPALGTGRLLFDGHIGRMAVAREARGLGVGAAVLRALMQAARERGHREVELHAQVHAQAFYERFGFAVIGPEFDDCGIPHVTMRAEL
jgi:predicted GNAT family N-acyltransferase